MRDADALSFVSSLACHSARRYKIRQEADAEAEKIQLDGEAAAKADKVKGEAEAEAMVKKAKAWGEYSRATFLDKIIAQLPAITAQARPRRLIPHP